MSVTNYERGRFIRCINKLQFMGFSEEEAKLLCAEKLFSDTETFEDVSSFINVIRKYVEDEEYAWDKCIREQTKKYGSEERAKKICGAIKAKYGDTDGKQHLKEIINKLDAEASDECVSRKISIISDEHPEWSHDQVVAVAYAWCRKYGNISDSEIEDARTKIQKTGELGTIVNISLRKFVNTIKAIKTKKSMKVGHMGILPFRTFLPMKSLNKLQTKLEKLLTAEQKFLTQEQLLQRSRYMGLMKKDSEPTIGDLLDEFCNAMIEEYPEIKKDEMVQALYEKLHKKRDSYYINSTTELKKINDQLNNIIKAPVILAREMVQQYKGGTERHFKPYDELIKALNGLEKLPIVVEHQNEISERTIVGYVKELKNDDEKRAIKGMAYLTEGKLPQSVKDQIDKNVVVPVSIGFFSKLGNGGEWNGQEYDFTQEDIILDHLAICIDTVARCPTGYCGINLDSLQEDESHTFTFKKKDDYYINICKLIDSQKTKKDNNSKLKEKNIMQEDSEFVPKDLKAFMHWIRRFTKGDATPEAKNELKNRILSAFKDSDIKMENIEELKDSITQKDSEIQKLKDSLDKNSKKLDSALDIIKKLQEEKRQELLKKIEDFAGDKFEDGELDEKEISELEIIYDSISRFAPSNDKSNVLPVEGKEDKKKMEDSLKGRRFDPRKLHEDVNKEFNLERFGIRKEEE